MKPATFTKARKSARGADGQDGENGLDGINGENGLDGKDGMSGAEGKDGRDGLAGINGHNGIDGKDGQDGDRGIHGLRGKQGEIGLQGDIGPQGKTGPKGDTGDTGPTPDHEIDKKAGKIRFRRDDGTWGAWLEVKREIIDRTVTNVVDSGGRGEQAAAMLKAWYSENWVGEDRLIVDGDAKGVSISNVKNLKLNTNEGAQAHVPGQLSFEPITGTGVMDTAYSDVRVNIGQEVQVRFYNSCEFAIKNGQVLNATEADITNKVFSVCLADATSPATSSSIIGIATHDVDPGQIGLATFIGEVRDFDTTHLSTDGPTYVGTTAGELTNTRPRYPSNVVFMGGTLESSLTGIVQVIVTRFSRNDVSTSMGFTSQGIGAGAYWKGGFYDWVSSSVALSQASLTQTLGTAGRTYAAHVGIVPSAAGTVDTGVVGLRVVGILDSETGVQVANQTGIITEDITTLTVDEMVECSEKFSGQVTLELYVVSGSPTAYSLTFNYGYSKYGDFFNTNATIIGFSALWQGNATDSAFDIQLFHHKSTGWTYAALGFEPGNGTICERLVDQQLASDVVNNEDGAYKRTGLDTYVSSGDNEGFLVKIAVTQNNSIQSMDLVVSAKSEDLS